MSSSVASVRGRSEVKGGDLPLMGAVRDSPRGVNDVDLAAGQWILDLLKEAIDSAYSHKGASTDMGMDKSLLTRQLSGDGHLSLRRVGLLPDYVICSWAGRIQSRYGVDDKAIRIERAMEMIEKGRSMLAAEASK